MRPQARFFLADARSTPLRVGRGWQTGAVLVLARHLCAYAKLPAAGLGRAQIAQVVRLQLPRISPFADAQAFYLKSGGAIHVWSWPRQLLEQAVPQDADRAKLRVLPSSLFAKPAPSVKLSSAEGVETLTFSDDGLKSSVFEFNEGASPTQTSAQVPQAVSQWAMWPKFLPWDAFGQVDGRSDATPARAVRSDAGRYWLVSGALACCAAAAGLGWFGQLRSAEAQRLSQANADFQALTRNVKPAAKVATNAAPAWAEDLAERLQRPSLARVVSQLHLPLQRQRLLVRELRLEQDQLQLTLAGSVPGLPSVDDAIAALEQSALGQVSFLEANATTGFLKLAIKLDASAFPPRAL